MKIAFIDGVKNAHPQIDTMANAVCDSFFYVSDSFSEGHAKKILKSVRLAFKIPRHDVYLVDEAFGVLVCALKKIFLREKCRVVMRVMTDFFCFERSPWYKKYFNRFLAGFIDGAIPVSDMVREEVEGNTRIPTVTVNEFLLEEACLKITPSRERNVVCIGYGSPARKGIDIVIECFRLLRKKGLVDNCYIGGYIEDMDKKYKLSLRKEDIFFTTLSPKIIDPKKYFRKGMLYMQPSRYDAGASAVIAAMACGLVPLVSHMTGNKDLVSQVDRKLVINSFEPAEYAGVAEAVLNNRKKLHALSKRSKEVSGRYTSEKQVEKFRKAIRELVH